MIIHPICNLATSTQLKTEWRTPDSKESMYEMYMLEIQRYVQSEGFEHVGYMNTLFRSKDSAAHYYNVNNPHLRNLNRRVNWKSDWDPTTRLRAVVRKYNGEIMTINTYNLADMPIQTNYVDVYTREFPTLAHDYSPQEGQILTLI